jgi:hypothetical protein
MSILDDIPDVLDTTAPVPSGAGVDELAAATAPPVRVAQARSILDDIPDISQPRRAEPAPRPTPAPAEAPAATGSILDDIPDRPPDAPVVVGPLKETGLTQEGLEQATGQVPDQQPLGEKPWMLTEMGRLLSEGVQRDWSRLRSTPGLLKGIYSELQGDETAMRQYMAEADAIEKEAPQAKWNLQNIKGVEDFFYWLSERFGENALTILATMATAGAGGLVAGAVSHGLRLGPGAARAAIVGGQFTPAFGLMSAVEGGSTAQELYEATGSTQPGWAIGAGLLKGGLETITPFLMTRALTKTGLQFGSNLPKGIVKGSLLEAGTEGTQEMVDIMSLKAHASREYLMRKFGDPDFSFLGSGPEWLGPAGWRMLEAMAAGGALGGLFGGATHYIERKQEAKAGGHEEPFIAPGQPSPPGEPPPPAAPSLVLPQGLSFTEHTQPNGAVTIEIQKGGEHKGRLYYRPDSPETLQAANLSLESELQRQGITSTVEDYLTAKYGKQIVPDFTLSDAEYKRWQKKAPELLADYKKDGSHWLYRPSMVSMLRKALEEERKAKEADPFDRPPGPDQAIIADDKVLITSSFDNKNTVTWNVKSDYGNIHARVNKRDKEVHLSSSGLKGSVRRGEGHGLALYKATVDHALSFGYTVRSDEVVSEEAARMYEGLKRRGYTVTGPHGKLVTEEEPLGGYYSADDPMHGVYRITAGPTTEQEFGEAKQIAEPPKIGDELRQESQVAGVKVQRPPERRVDPLPTPEEQEAFENKLGDGTVPPITRMMEKLRPPGAISGEVNLNESLALMPDEDVFDLTSLLKSMTELGAEPEAVADWAEGQTKRYAVTDPESGKIAPRLLNDVDLERFLSGVPAWYKLQVDEVRQGMLEPGAITADIMDLPPPDSNRLWFMPRITGPQRLALIERYSQLRQVVENNRVKALADPRLEPDVRTELEPFYNEIVSQGLRVVPSYGASFNYTGLMERAGPGPTSSKRSKQIVLLDPITHTLISVNLAVGGGGRVFGLSPQESRPDLALAALDLNKFKPGEISAFPEKDDIHNMFPIEEKFKFRKGMSEKQKSEATVKAIAAIEQQDAELFRSAMRDGMYIEPKKTSKVLVTKDTTSFDKLVATSQWFDPNALGKGETNLEKIGVNIREIPEDQQFDNLAKAYEESNPAIKTTAGIVKSMIPVTNKILKDLGIKGRPVWWVSASGDSSMMRGGLGVIQIDAESSVRMATLNGVSLETVVYGSIAHELGHYITMHHYAYTSPEMQAKIKYAYERAKLAARTTAIPEARLYTQTLSPENVLAGQRVDQFSATPIQYYMTFSEFLAEQFSRVMMSDTAIRSEVDQAYANIGEKLNEYVKAWERAGGPRIGRDVSEPDVAFSAWMDYLRHFGQEKERVDQKMKQLSLNVFIGERKLTDSPYGVQLLNPVLDALKQFEHMFPPHFYTRLLWKLGDKDVLGAIVNEGFTTPTMELAVGAMPSEQTLETARQVIAHELIHAMRAMNLINQQEFDILLGAAREAQVVSESSLYQAYRPRIEEWGEKNGFNKQNTWSTWKEKILTDVVNEEMVAYYIGALANGTIATTAVEQRVLTIFDKFMAILRAIREAIFKTGIPTREEVVRRFFAGEMANRGQRALRQVGVYAHMTRMMDVDGHIVNPSKIVPVLDMPGVYAAVEYLGDMPDLTNVFYIFYRRPPLNANAPHLQRDLKVGGQVLGWVRLDNTGRKGWEPHIETTGKTPGFTKGMIDFVEDDMRIELKPAGQLTEAGYLVARLRFKQEMKLYQFDPESGQWVSPNYIREVMGFHEYTVKYSNASAAQKEWAQGRFEKWKAMYAKVPKEVWKNPLLEKMHMLPESYFKDGAYGKMIENGDRVEDSQIKDMMGMMDGGPTVDPFEAINRQVSTDSLYENSKRGGTSMEESAPQLPMYGLRELFRQSRVIGDVTPLERSLLSKNVVEADRINWFTRIWYGIKQMAWRNPSVRPLQMYVMNVENMHSSIANWLTRADDTARIWDGRDKNFPMDQKQRAAVSKMLFWLAEMRYRTQAEILSNAPPRHPTPAERAAQERSLGLSRSSVQLVARIQKDFADFLTEVERISIEKITRTLTDPTARANALAKLASQMAEFRAKPYFPMTRFGRHTITVRDPSQKDQVVAMYAFDTLTQRRTALPNVIAQHPGMKIVNGVVPESAFEFMGLPTPLLQTIRTEMQPSLTPDQLIWIEEFERLHSPDNTFRNRWLPQTQLPGYSIDGFRVYASYFITGSRYLGRAEFGHPMGVQIELLRQSLRSGRLINPRKRAQMVNYVQRHHRYIMEGGKDYAKVKAFISVWQLGFSVAAAGMNMTQVPHVTWPFLSGVFGTGKASAALQGVSKALKHARGYAPKGSGQYTKAREILRTWQLVDVGQAAELGAFAEGQNLFRLSAGSKAQRWVRNGSTWAMKMFSAVEAFNREWTALAAYELALKNTKAKYKPDKGLLGTTGVPTIEEAMTIKYQTEWRKLINPANFADGVALSNEEAIATLFARETIQRTQFVYAPYARPAFLRHPLGSVFLVFFGYIQAMTYAFRFNPGMVQFLLIATLLYGLSGAIPGGEDLAQLIRAIGKKLFGKDWDAEHQARKFFRDMTQGTVLDEVGPDLFLHGMSKYGFGLGLLPEGYGIGKFDASANGSLGKIVPGLFEAARAVSTGGDYKQIVTDVSQRMAGAGFGWFFTALKVSMEPSGSSTMKTWEQLMPRAAKALVKAYRYGTEGETTRQGGRIATFDIADPEDAAALAWQVIGFTPTKVSNTWDYLRAVRDQLNVYKADKLILYGQMDRAMTSRNPDAINDVIKAILRFNQDVMEVDPSMAIKDVNSVRQSIINRNRTRLMQEMHLPNVKGQVPVAERLRDMYPGTARPPAFSGQRFTSKEAQNTADTIEGARRLLRHDWRINPEGRLSEMVEDRREEGTENPTGGLETEDQARRRQWEEEMLRRQRPF